MQFANAGALAGLVGISLAILAHAQTPSPRRPVVDEFTKRLVDAALERTTHDVTYDGSYRRIAFPGGDVPDSLGVCTDVIIRSYRAGVGTDLQLEVHRDMKAHFDSYPGIWGLSRPDTNIDHRRVPNLRVFFERHGVELEITDDPGDYRPGDIVTWRIPGNLPHIGLVTDRRASDGVTPLIVHNIGSGPRLEDRLFRYVITGHYRYGSLEGESRGRR